jgi:hypothetical protein
MCIKKEEMTMKTKKTKVYPDTLERMLLLEDGLLDVEDTIELFQELINSGLAWKLQGFYGRTASNLIQQGYCTMNKGALEQ